MTTIIKHDGHEVEIHEVVSGRFGKLIGLISIDGEPATQEVYYRSIAEVTGRVDSIVADWNA